MRLRKLPIGAALLAGLFLGASASGATPGLSLIRDMVVALPSCWYPIGDCHTYKCDANGDYSVTGNRANGTTCNDLDACTTGDKCQSGECVGTTLAGINDGNVCTADSCNSSTGGITHTLLTNGCCSAGIKLSNLCCNAGSPKANGTTCDNATVCDGRETCQAGICTAGTPLVVDDGNPCTADSCNPATGVTHAPITSACCSAGVSGAGQVCRTAAGPCDVAEVCTGSSTLCPADLFRNSSDVCRSSTGMCDPAEFCTGLGPTCPADTRIAAGQACSATAPCQCTVGEACIVSKSSSVLFYDSAGNPTKVLNYSPGQACPVP